MLGIKSVAETFVRECSFVRNNTGQEMHSLRNEQQFGPRQKHESHPQGGRAPVGNKSRQRGRVVRKEHELRLLSLSLFPKYTGDSLTKMGFELDGGQQGGLYPRATYSRKFHSVYICHAKWRRERGRSSSLKLSGEKL